MAIEESTTEATASSNGAESTSTVETLSEPVVPQGAKTLAVEPAGLATLGYEYPRYPIAPGYRVYVRTGPGTNYAAIRLLPVGAM
ncbi:hypothetical protein ACWD3D_37075, partial [Streptomyces sp. NPDC002690]